LEELKSLKAVWMSSSRVIMMEFQKFFMRFRGNIGAIAEI